MGQVAVTINTRTYRLACGPGEEGRLRELAAHLALRVERLAMDFGQHGDERLLVMAALLTTDELLEARARLAELDGGQEHEATAAKAAAAVASESNAAAPAAGANEAAVADAALPVDVAPGDRTGASDDGEPGTDEPAPAAGADPSDGAAAANASQRPQPAVPSKPTPRTSLEARLAAARQAAPRSGGA